MIEKAEIGISGKAICDRYGCRKKIKKFEVRGILYSGKFICEKCLIKELPELQKEIDIIKRDAEKLLKLSEKDREILLIKNKIIDELR
jgi:hypothetical protein